MLTLLKEIFTWWNRQTLGTRLYTLFYGKKVGEDNFGNKYFQNRNGSRWVIFKGEIEATQIPIEWYSWIHHTKNKIENSHDLKKYNWQKDHLSNQTGSDNSYHPKKFKNVKKKYKSWKS